MKKRIKISILTSSDFPYGMAAESFVRQMSLGLNANNVIVEVIRLYGDRHKNINDTGIKCTNYLFNKPLVNDFVKFFEVLCQVLYIPFFVILRKIKKDQIIILYGLDRAYFVFPLTLISRLFNIKIFRIITEVYPSYKYAYKWWRLPNVLFNKWQIKYFDKYLNGVVVLSHFLKKLEIKNGVKEKNILVIPHFIDIINFDLSSKISNNRIRIGYCGNPSIENGILDLVDAFIKLSSLQKYCVELIIIGEISFLVKNEINKRNLNSTNYILTGKLSSKEVFTELQKCDILVNPRRLSILASSGFPTKIGEYFASKKPVVATKVGDLEIYFEDKVELIFAEPNSPDSICESLIYLIENYEEAIKIADNGNKWAINNLHYISNSKKLINFINKLKS